MGSLKLLGDRILTFDKVRRTDRKVFHSKYWHGPQSTCMLFYFLTYLDVFREEEKKTDKLVMSCRFFSVTTTLWYPQIGMGSYWRGSLPKKYYTDLNITFHKKNKPFQYSFNEDGPDHNTTCLLWPFHNQELKQSE